MDGSTLQQILGSAEHAVRSGDYQSAEALLREAARLQESTLGRHHPDVASTFNNLAVVCEKSNNLAAAEEYYERAFSIASASLDAEHPLVTTSRNNLDEFRRAHGTTASPLATMESVSPVPPVEPVPLTPVQPVPPVQPLSPTALRVGAAVVVLLVVALGLWLMRTPSSRADPDAQAASPVAEQDVTSSPTTAKNMSAKSRAASSNGARRTTPVTTQPSEAPRVIEASLCQNLTTGARWQCTPASGSSSAGLLFFYTRIAAPQRTRIHHRWYRNGRLRQDIALAIDANPSAGYRTYTRQRLDEGEWRVELVTGDGVVLHNETVAIR
jgi:hypothetical protein